MSIKITNSFYSPVTIEDREIAVKNISKKRTSHQMVVQASVLNVQGRDHFNFMQTYAYDRKTELILYRLRQVSITLLPRPDKNIAREENYRLISLINADACHFS